MFLDPSLHFLAAQGEIAKIKEEIDRGMHIDEKVIIFFITHPGLRTTCK